jgi:hypothetical protein
MRACGAGCVIDSAILLRPLPRSGQGVTLDIRRNPLPHRCNPRADRLAYDTPRYSRICRSPWRIAQLWFDRKSGRSTGVR